MTDTQWADISEYQVPVNDSYPYGFICIRANDGDYLDGKFHGNLSWCKSRLTSGKLWGYMVYYLYRPGVNGAKTLMAQVGKPDSRVVAMIDVENVGGQVSGDQSAAINAQYHELASWLGDARRVVGYGNVYDLDSLWPAKPHGIRLIIAAYGSNPGYPGKYAHQYTDKGACAPFGTCDMNAADGMSQHDLENMYGFSDAGRPVKPTPPPAAPPFPYPPTDYLGMPSADPHCHSGHYGPPDSGHVRTWQQQMAMRGWAILVDGDFGTQSRSVCCQFQAEKGLAVDGLVGTKTWHASWTEPVT